MEKESNSTKWIRYSAAVVGIVAIFLPWSRAQSDTGFITLDYQATLWKIILMSPGELAIAGAVLFVAGTAILIRNSAGIVAQFGGMFMLSLSLLDWGAIGYADFEDVNMTLGMGFYVGLISVALAFAGFMYRWAWTKTPSS